MAAPSRRTALQSIAGVMLGGLAYSRRPHWPGFFGGFIRAHPLESMIDSEEHDDQLPPDEFVTSRDDGRLSDLDQLRAAFQRPREQVELSRREFGTAFRALEGLPVFDPDAHAGFDHPAVVYGIYVRDAEYTYRLQLVPWCSDQWWIRTSGMPEGRSTCSCGAST